MPYVYSQGLRIHYQIDGDGPPLVFQHLSDGAPALQTPSWRSSGRRSRACWCGSAASPTTYVCS